MCGHAREGEACSSIIGGLFLTVIHVFIQVHQDLPPPRAVSWGGALTQRAVCASCPALEAHAKHGRGACVVRARPGLTLAQQFSTGGL